MSKRPLSIVLLTDGKPGHENQSRGLVRYLKLQYDCNVVEITCRLKMKPLSRQIFTRLINHGLNKYSSKWVLSGSDIHAYPDSANLVVSAGGDTMFANIALAQMLGARSVFIGSPRKVYVERFSWLLTLEDYGADNNIVMPLAPLAQDASKLAEAGRSIRNELKIGEAPVVGVLVGGDGAGYQYDAADWDALASGLNSICAQSNAELLFTSSRRTGVEAEELIRRGIKEQFLADAVWYGVAPRKVISPYLGAADVLVVTVDSMSMISEAASTGKPVYVVKPRSGVGDRKYIQSLERMASSGWVKMIDLNDLGSVQVSQNSTNSNGVDEFWLKMVSHIAE